MADLNVKQTEKMTEYYDEKLQSLRWFSTENKLESIKRCKTLLGEAQDILDDLNLVKKQYETIVNTDQDTVVGYYLPIYGQATNSYGAMVNIDMWALVDKSQTVVIGVNNLEELIKVRPY